MSGAPALFCWLSALPLAAWGRRRLALAAVFAALALTPFTQQMLQSWWQGEETFPVAGPGASFLSAWMLVLFPILRRSFDRETWRANLQQGLAALAAVALAADSAVRLADLLPQESRLLVPSVLFACGISYFAGMAWRLLGWEHPFPWEYPAWAAAWLTMLAPAIPSLAVIQYGHGLGALMLTYGTGCLLYLGRRDLHLAWRYSVIALCMPPLLAVVFAPFLV